MKRILSVSLLFFLSVHTYGRSEFFLKGSVVNHEGAPMAGLNIAVYEKDLRNEKLLGRITSDARGNFLIKYIMNNERNSLFIKVTDKSGKVLYKSNIVNPAGNEFLKIIIPKGSLTIIKRK